MRRNRQKLHQELRLHAEAQKAARLERRLARLAARERSRTVFTRPVTRSVPRDDGAARILAVVESLLGLANVAPTLRTRVLRVCRAVRATIPNLFTVEQLPWFLLLAKPTWVRDPETFVPPGGSVRRKRDALAQHLLVEFPAPMFLLRSLDVDPIAVARVPVEDEWAVALLSHLGRGQSLREVVGSALLPMPLTRRMCHLFADATAPTSPILALRSAQVKGFGGPPTLATTLLHTRLGRIHGADPAIGEPFWHEVLGWLCRRTALHGGNAQTLDGLLAWIELQQREALRHQTTFPFHQRPDAAILRDAEQWRRAQLRLSADALPPSGFLAHARDGYTLTEIVRKLDLAEEGRAMSHCVAMYAGLIRARKVAIWSLRRGGRRLATVEVSLGAGQVVQAKRAANRPCGAMDLVMVREWAALNHLGVAF